MCYGTSKLWAENEAAEEEERGKKQVVHVSSRGSRFLVEVSACFLSKRDTCSHLSLPKEEKKTEASKHLIPVVSSIESKRIELDFNITKQSYMKIV